MDRLFRSANRLQIGTRIAALIALLAALNGGAWFALLVSAHAFPLLLPLGVTAYLLGLRHAVDPDHIAAIDGTTRKLMRDGQRPVAVGFYFSLGHSTIVFVLSLLVAFFGTVLTTQFPALRTVGTTLGTWISAAFLLAIAAANAVVLLEILRSKSCSDAPELPGGVLARVLRPALNMVRSERQMYPVGVLFGLGFDTATEIALLGISAASGAGGMPVLYILLLPALFAAGMSLVDSLEGIAMLGAYGWAYLQPARKMLYNVNMTLISIIIAAFVGGAQALAAMGTHPALSFPTLGYGIMAIFGANLGVSAFLYRFRASARTKTPRRAPLSTNR